MTGLRAVELRDLGRIDNLAREILTQTGHLRRNMEGGCEDRLRYWLIEGRAARLLGVAERRVRVWERSRP